MKVIKSDYYRIKDECRKVFLKYLEKEVSVILVNEVHSIGKELNRQQSNIS